MKTFEEIVREYARHIAADMLRDYARHISETCTFTKKVTWGTVQRNVREWAASLDGNRDTE